MKILILLAVLAVLRLVVGRFYKLNRIRSRIKLRQDSRHAEHPLATAPWQRQLRTVLVFTKLSTRRFFRDRLAQFFAILFPLIFLFVFGSLTNGNGNVSFNVAVINQSKTD